MIFVHDPGDELGLIESPLPQSYRMQRDGQSEIEHIDWHAVTSGGFTQKMTEYFFYGCALVIFEQVQ